MSKSESHRSETWVSLLVFILAACSLIPDSANLDEQPARQSKRPSFHFSVSDALPLDTVLNLPPRPSTAPTGTQLTGILTPLDLEKREARILNELVTGNIPEHLRTLIPVHLKPAKDVQVTVWVTPDYLTLGSDGDHFLIPMTPLIAQRLADTLGCIIPTPKLVDLIWEAAEVKLEPRPIPPSDTMVTIPVFANHNLIVQSQRQVLLADHPLGTLVAGHKKDVVLSQQLGERPGKVFIYGWHQPGGEPIQPVYGGHAIWYVDYSHGIRLIKDSCLVNGEPYRIEDILTDETCYHWLSSEAAPMTTTRYQTGSELYSKIP